MFAMCAENVDRLCSMDCSSPTSASTRSNTRTTLPSSAGMCRPHCAIRHSSPSVLSVTVLPPVFGPVMTRVSNCWPSSTLMGTAFAGSSSGWRARRRTIPPRRRTSGRAALI